MTNTFSTVIDLIDDANSRDPNIETNAHGEPVPKELLYSVRMSECLASFIPNASEHLKIAARGQHIERWKSARSNYPPGRVGYLTWRKELGLFHAKRVGELMSKAGYQQVDIERTEYIVQKKAIKRDHESQALEDVICLVFLSYYLDDFAVKHNEDKLIDIIQKTWTKMSESGHDAALKIDFSENMMALVQKALA